MVAIDTNIIVRFLTRDHETQYREAYRVFKKHELFIPDTVIQETEWVLRYAYDFQPEDICDAFGRLFGLSNVNIANPHSTAQAIKWHRDGLDFSDALHLSLSQECDELYSFDAQFIEEAMDRTSCVVRRP